jgi:malate permease and related proteins
MHQVNFLLFHVLTPIFLQVGAGFLIQKRFPLDISSLSKIQFYIFIPALIFGSIYRTPLAGSEVLTILECNLAVFLALLFVGWLVARLAHMERARRQALYNSVCLYNSGNYCIPLIQLLYNTPLSYSIQIIVLLLQSTITNTFGIINSGSGHKRLGATMLQLLSMPATPAMLLALVFRELHWTIWQPLELSLDALSQGLVPLALVTLGAQLAASKMPRPSPIIFLSSMIRLLGGPLLAWGMISLLGIGGVAGQVIVICSGAPSAVNSVLLALELGGDAQFASQTVLFSTALSAITMPLVISMALALI